MSGYARPMPDWNQGSSWQPPVPGPTPPSDPLGGFAGAGAPANPPALDLEAAHYARRGVAAWMIGMLILLTLSLFTSQWEVAGLAMIGGLFAAAHGADADPLWRRLFVPVSLVAPLAGIFVFGRLAIELSRGDLPTVARAVAVGFAAFGVAFSIASVFPAMVDPLARALFRSPWPREVLRLATRLVIMGFLLAVPWWFMFSAKSGVAENLEPLLEKSHLGGELVGYILLALGGVGFLVRRDFVESMRRLGLRGVALTDFVVLVVGVVMLLLLNAGGDRVQHRFFPDLWRSDHDMTAQIARSVTGMRLLIFGLTAGVGEEITMRGALQPRLGIVLTALFFASLHVQYSWFGIMLVMGLGIVLGLIRARTSTTVAMLVHAVYDMLAVFTT